MHLTPLLSASAVIQIHTLAALTLLPLTVTIFSLPRGDRRHRWLGWCWVILMTTVAVSSLAIHQIQLIGRFSPIHILSALALVGLVQAVTAARRKDIVNHRRTMVSMTWGALVVAGLFTLLPGRILFQVLTGS